MKIKDYIDQELPFKAWLDEYLKPDEVKTVFDIGACEAEDSIKLSRVYKNATVYAFEPLPKNVELCKKHIDRFSATNIQLFPLALSDKSGETTFFVSSGQPEIAKNETEWDYGNKSSSLLPPAKTKEVHEWLKFNEEITVKTERLDNFIEKHKIKQVDFLYMDVQGAELLVLEGAGKVLKDVKAIWLEVEAVELYKDQPLRKDIEKFMKSAGFSCVMDTVDNVSGDQLYVSRTIIEKTEKQKLDQPAAYFSKVSTLLKYISSVWDKNELSESHKVLLENRTNELNDKFNNLSAELNKHPAVSVLLSVYNGERFLAEAIEGVLKQSYKNFEFVIINDGSSDKSLDIINSYTDDRIRVINQLNHGFIYSLNKGVELARGEFIARMDQDDIAKPERLKKQLTLFEKNPRLGAVSTYFELIDFEKGQPLGKTMVFPTNSIDIKRALYLHNPMAHGSTTFRKEAWKEAGKYRSEYHPPEDYDLWRRIAKNWDLGMVPEVLFQYRINNPDSMSQQNISNGAENFKKIQREIIEGPYMSKSIFSLIRDYKMITENTYGIFSQQVKEDYVHMQRNLSNLFLDEMSAKKAYDTTLFSFIVDPLKSRDLTKRFLKILLINFTRKTHIR